MGDRELNVKGATQRLFADIESYTITEEDGAKKINLYLYDIKLTPTVEFRPTISFSGYFRSKWDKDTGSIVREEIKPVTLSFEPHKDSQEYGYLVVKQPASEQTYMTPAPVTKAGAMYRSISDEQQGIVARVFIPKEYFDKLEVQIKLGIIKPIDPRKIDLSKVSLFDAGTLPTSKIDFTATALDKLRKWEMPARPAAPAGETSTVKQPAP